MEVHYSVRGTEFSTFAAGLEARAVAFAKIQK